MSDVKTRIPLDKSMPYKADWHQTQAEQDAYDDLMRRKINPQTASYVENNELICFGLSEHSLEEKQNIWTPQAKKEIANLSSWFPKRKMEEVTRPVYKSDFNWTNVATRANLRCLLGLLVIRELPIKSFYSRTAIGYLWITFFVYRGLGRGLMGTRPIFFYNNDFHNKSLINYPDLFWWKVARIAPKNPPIPNPHIEWMTAQKPVFHQHHKNVYRYRFRKPRYVQWDGSMNQPVMPYLHDHGTDVPNGTFRRNCNSDPQLR